MLKAAYTNKEMMAQMAEKEARKYDHMAREAEVARAMEVERRKAEEAEKQRDMEKLLKNAIYQQQLEKQLEVGHFPNGSSNLIYSSWSGIVLIYFNCSS